jgi:hypothetical protein
LTPLEEGAAKEGIVYAEAQLTTLETAKQSRESNPDEIEKPSIPWIFRSLYTHPILEHYAT